MQQIPDSVPEDMKLLLQKFHSILSMDDLLPTPTHGVEHTFTWAANNLPVFAKSHRLDPGKREIAKAEFKRLEFSSIVCRSKSPRASPLHMVPKKDRSWRHCGDYRRLNLVTTPDKYPCQTYRTFQMVCMVATFFGKLIL
jgi:hypothetical protein